MAVVQASLLDQWQCEALWGGFHSEESQAEHIRLYSYTLEDLAASDMGRPGWTHLRAADGAEHFRHRVSDLAQKWSPACCHMEHQRDSCSPDLEMGKHLSAVEFPRSVSARWRRVTEEAASPPSQRHSLTKSLTGVDKCATQARMLAFDFAGLWAEDHRSLGANASHLGLPPC